jgi:superfamily II DNA/RNA helicase
MPQGADRQTMMFSATFPSNIQRLASDFMRDYVFLTVGRVGSASKDVTQTIEYVEEQDKLETLMRFLLTIEEVSFSFLWRPNGHATMWKICCANVAFLPAPFMVIRVSANEKKPCALSSGLSHP